MCACIANPTERRTCHPKGYPSLSHILLKRRVYG
ncbi:hypothetical protein [Citrobacter phage Tr1]|nr:hypothetical protein [Citrobacter phage Tr1]